MKSALTAFALIAFFGFAILNDKLDKTNGFENYKFGTQPGNYKNLTLEIDEGNTRLYSTDPKEIKIDGVSFSYIRLTFTKNNLSGIVISTSKASGTAILHYLKNQYGEPIKQKNELIWKGYKIKLIYEAINNNKDAVVTFYCI